MKRPTVYLTMMAALVASACVAGEVRAQGGPSLDGEWLIGEWIHRSETDEGKPLVVKRVCERTLGDHYLTALTKIQVAGNVVLVHKHMMRYDPVREENHSWVFSSNGDFSQGRWKQTSTRIFGGALAGQTVGGKRKSASSTYEWVDGNTYIYRLYDRTIGLKSLPEDIEWDFHRIESGQ